MIKKQIHDFQNGNRREMDFIQQHEQSKAGKETQMLRVMMITALLCASEAAFAQELTAEQRSACMGDYQKFWKGRR